MPPESPSLWNPVVEFLRPLGKSMAPSDWEVHGRQCICVFSLSPGGKTPSHASKKGGKLEHLGTVLLKLEEGRA